MRALQQGGATVDYTLQFRDVWLNRDFFIEGLYFTVYLTVVSMSVAVVIGTLAAVARNSANRFVRTIASTYVEVVRNTPLLIQLWLVYFGLSQIGIELNALNSGLLVLSLNTGAY